ncbi:MAG: glycosyltransferase family 52 [Ruminococcus sp.]
MKSIFVCHTVYHVYIALMKNYNLNGSSIILVDTIPGYKKLANRIKKSKVFKDVFVVDRDLYFGRSITTFLGNYINNRISLKKVKRNLKFLNEYENIYIFNDYSEFGDYLNLINKKYHLLEDGLDVFKQFDVYEDIGHGYKIKKLLYRLFKIPYSVGMNECCIDIEVNDDKDLKTLLLHPVVVCNRTKLLKSISYEYINNIFQIYGVKNIEMRGKKILLLTQVLKEILVVKSELEQIELYRTALKEYAADYNIYIKPHPRDKIDYSVLVQEYGAICLEREIPMEVYCSLPHMSFDIVLTYSSTAANINNLGSMVIRLDERL